MPRFAPTPYRTGKCPLRPEIQKFAGLPSRPLAGAGLSFASCCWLLASPGSSQSLIRPSNTLHIGMVSQPSALPQL